jgi:hypothetical protein
MRDDVLFIFDEVWGSVLLGACEGSTSLSSEIPPN